MPTVSDFRTTALRAADRLPLVSVVLHRALSLFAQGEDLAIGELAAVIEQDVVIAGSVLSIANSALYGRFSTVTSVRQAIARLGVHKTRNSLLALSITKSFHGARIPGQWSSIRFNAHSLATAAMSELIAQTVPSEHPEWAFMAGLLHDIGLLVIAAGLPEQFQAIAPHASSDFHLIQREEEVLGFNHCGLGAEMLARWNCPTVVQEAARFCDRAAFQFEQPLPLGAVVKTASLLADAHGLSIFHANPERVLTAEVLEALEVPAPVEFIATFEMEYSGLQSCAA
jgi:putative nucleotidyltransferase with HDIG domain